MPATCVFCNLVVIRTRDMNRAREFYKALGMALVQHSHGSGPVHLACEMEGQVFEIYPLGENDLPTTSARIGFCVPSVDEAYQALLAAGGQKVSSPRDSEWGRRAVVADPDGHRVELTAPAKDFMAHKEPMDAGRKQSLEQLTKLDQELGLGY